MVRGSLRLRTLLAVLIAVCVLPAWGGTSRPEPEYEVKGTFLYHFAQMVKWPGDAPQERALTLCAFPEDAHYEQIERTVQAQFASDSVLTMRAISSEQEAVACNMVFFGRGLADRQPAFLKTLRNSPVLTVGESEEFLAAGGVIRFRVDQGQVRFDVNMAAAETAHLKISARLLMLATHVVYGPGSSAEGK